MWVSKLWSAQCRSPQLARRAGSLLLWFWIPHHEHCVSWNDVNGEHKLPSSRKVTKGDMDPPHKHTKQKTPTHIHKHTPTHLKKHIGQVSNSHVVGYSVHKTVWFVLVLGNQKMKQTVWGNPAHSRRDCIFWLRINAQKDFRTHMRVGLNSFTRKRTSSPKKNLSPNFRQPHVYL